MFITSEEAEARAELEYRWRKENQTLKEQQDKSHCAEYDFY